ncbi:hypothetical protein EFO61_02245 [Lacticaseibacillus rhamnosus]|nr:hypothetical protein [Lacticaseibacillus rhamnosus]MCT3153080.1 hypothetical protein [Lacticaseibacillus rhamnosus]MCT3160809.1 hypothetical protein [Lacticaseibacillus rhamnosus]MCT3164171.1 hypothetical protein [Lacticaseibacillus rhamnosus]MCT3167167.1 hypothetical protein [Lacticaseibacillus rhamnosus]
MKATDDDIGLQWSTNRCQERYMFKIAPTRTGIKAKFFGQKLLTQNGYGLQKITSPIRIGFLPVL